MSVCELRGRGQRATSTDESIEIQVTQQQTGGEHQQENARDAVRKREKIADTERQWDSSRLCKQVERNEQSLSKQLTALQDLRGKKDGL